MVFKSKMDRTFKGIIFGGVIVLLIIFLAILLIEGVTKTDMWIIFACFLFTIGLILWLALDITYTFKEDHLLLRAGFLFTRIRYEDIESYRHLNGIMDIISGFNLLSSSNGLAILSQKVMLGEVKISPFEKEAFIEELEKRLKQVSG